MTNKQVKATADDILRILSVRRSLLLPIAYDPSSQHCDNACTRLDELDWVQLGLEKFFNKNKGDST